MAKKRASLADIMQNSAPSPGSLEGITPTARAAVVPLVQAASQPLDIEPQVIVPAPEVRPEGRGGRRDKPHTTVYLDPAVRLAIKRIALDYNKKAHDLMIEGIDMMLIKYTGKPSKDHIT